MPAGSAGEHCGKRRQPTPHRLEAYVLHFTSLRTVHQWVAHQSGSARRRTLVPLPDGIEPETLAPRLSRQGRAHLPESGNVSSRADFMRRGAWHSPCMASKL